MMKAMNTMDGDIDDAVRILRRGGLVAFPTETVYGLGADAANVDALRRLYAVKGRPWSHPVIVHLATGSPAAGGEMHDHRVGPGAALDGIEPSERVDVGGVGAKPVDRLSRESHQPAPSENPHGVVDVAVHGVHRLHHRLPVGRQRPESGGPHG